MVGSSVALCPRDTSSEGLPTRLPGAPRRDDRRPSTLLAARHLTTRRRCTCQHADPSPQYRPDRPNHPNMTAGIPASRVMERRPARAGEPAEYSQCSADAVPSTSGEVARRDRSIKRVSSAQPRTSGRVLEALFADEPGARDYAAIRAAERMGELRNPPRRASRDVRGGSSRRCRPADSGKATHQVFLGEPWGFKSVSKLSTCSEQGKRRVDVSEDRHHTGLHAPNPPPPRLSAGSSPHDGSEGHRHGHPREPAGDVSGPLTESISRTRPASPAYLGCRDRRSATRETLGPCPFVGPRHQASVSRSPSPPQTSDGALLDLGDTRGLQPEVIADLLQRPRLAPVQAEPQLQHLRLAGRAATTGPRSHR